MRFLFDANLWFELFLERSHSGEVRSLLDAVPGRLIGTTDFALYALGLFVARQQPEVFVRFLNDLLGYEIGILHLPTGSLLRVLDVIKAHHLDFDDSLQYVVAERFDLRIVSLDADFDHTPRGRLTRAQALAEWSSPPQAPKP